MFLAEFTVHLSIRLEVSGGRPLPMKKCLAGHRNGPSKPTTTGSSHAQAIIGSADLLDAPAHAISSDPRTELAPPSSRTRSLDVPVLQLAERHHLALSKEGE